MSNIVFNMPNGERPPLSITFDTVCKKHLQESVKRPHGLIDFHQILIVLDGTGEVKCEGKRYPLKKGSAFFTARGVPHEYINKGGLVTAFLSGSGSTLDELISYYSLGGFIYYESVDEQKYLSLISDVIKEYFENKRQSVLSSMTYSFWIEFFEEKEKEKRDVTDAVKSYLEKNFSKKLTLSHLALELDVSVSKLCHDFKKRFGETVFQHILNLRLTYAKNLINSDPFMKTSTVANLSGFDDVSYFCRAYKQKFKKRPSEEKKVVFDLQNSQN